jgi:hypothetical protein
MKRSIKYVALDVHQATTVASVRERNGRVIARGILPTEEQALFEFFAAMHGSIHVAFEEGTQAQWLPDLLKQIRQRAKSAMLAEARKDPGWECLLSIPFLGPVRVAMLLAILQTP